MICNKIVFRVVNVSFSTFFKFSPATNTRGHPYKLHKMISYIVSTAHVTDFFWREIANVWNCLPLSVNYSTLCHF